MAELFNNVYIRNIMEYVSPDIKIFMISASKLGKWWENCRFQAPHWRLYWNQEPGVTISYMNKSVELKENLIALIAPDTAFKANCTGNPLHFYIHFSLADSFGRIKPGIYTFPAQEDFKKKALAMAEHALGKALPRTNATALSGLSMICSLLSEFPADQIEEGNFDKRVIDAMCKLEDKPVRNEILAKEACMSTNSFVRLFRTQTGLAPQTFSRKKRIEKACLMLKFTQQDIKTIASECGFVDRFHFTKVFIAERKESPGLFRKSLKPEGGLA